MQKGDKVIITFNPHHKGVEQVIGTVKNYRPRAGVGGCDLVDVEYANPNDGKRYTMPFGRHNLLESGSAADFLKMAEHYEVLAEHCRSMTQKLSAKE